MKVVVSPISLFSDDTSGNLSKQYNLFDSYVWSPAAYTPQMRGSKNNTYFICTSNKVLSAVDMIPALVDNLEKLENGVEMYSVIHDCYVLVVASLLFIQGDNYRQSELSMHKGSAASFFCRKCLIHATPIPNKKPRKSTSIEKRIELESQERKLIEPIDHYYCFGRNKEFLKQFLSKGFPLPAYNKSMVNKEFACGRNKSAHLLRLKAYDPTLDTPVELLHTLPLGVCKMLVQHLWNTVLTEQQKKELQLALASYRGCKSYTRAFRAQMQHDGSFLGKDFKIMAQILPVVLRNTFSTILPSNNILDLSLKCFETLGSLCSIVYMRKITNTSITKYTQLVKLLIDQLTNRIFNLDNACITARKPDSTQLLSLTPKLHILHHLPEDIIRFGPALHFETEHGEQFNKFIRHEILLTNRHMPSRDVAVGFAKEFTAGHLINGGCFFVKKKNEETGQEETFVATPGLSVTGMKEKYKQFQKMIFDLRENAENNGSLEDNSRFAKGMAGVFVSGNRAFLGRICRVTASGQGGSMIEKYVQEYSFVMYNEETSRVFFDSYKSAMFPSMLTTQDNNIVLDPIGNERIIEESTSSLVERMDMESLSNTGNGRRLLNVHKFGTIWSLFGIFQSTGTLLDLPCSSE